MAHKWDKLQTEEILHQLMHEKQDARNMLKTYPPGRAPTLKAYLASLLAERDLLLMDIVNQSQLSKPYIYQVFSGVRSPGRDALVRIMLVLSPNLETVQHALRLAGKPALYPRVRRDAALIYCLSSAMSLADACDFLETVGEQSLL